MGDDGRKILDLITAEDEILAQTLGLTKEKPNEKKAKNPIVVTMNDVQSEDVEWLWNPYIPFGKLTLLEGDPGLGKTWLALQLAANVSQGNPFPGQDGISSYPREAASVIYMSAEDGLADTLRPRLDAAGADVTKVFALTGWKEEGEDGKNGAVTLRDIEVIEKALLKTRPALMVVDPLQAYLGAGVDMHRANETRPVLSALAGLAERHKVAVLCIRHLGKSQQDRSIYRGLGSIDFAAAARSILLVGQIPNDKSGRVIAHVKSSLAPLGPSIGYELREGGFYWTGISELTAEQLLSPVRDKEETSSIDEAIEFLKDILSSGHKPVKEIFSEAKNSGISERTLKRAKAELNVTAQRQSEGNRGGGKWYWSMTPQGGQRGKVVTFPLKGFMAPLRTDSESLAGQGLWQQDHDTPLEPLPEALENKDFSDVSQECQDVPLGKEPQEDQNDWEEI